MSDGLSAKVKLPPGSVVLQLSPLTDGPTPVIKLVPPDPTPVASDMTRKSCWFTGKLAWTL